jgi:hypothetical protein
MTMTLADLFLVSDDQDWEQGACRGDQHPDRWFPHPTEPFDYAAGVCARCPIQNSCGTYAATNGETGVWGGREFRRGHVVR